MVTFYRDVDAPQINSSHEKQVHQVTLPYPWRTRSHKADYAGVLIMAKFAEDLDPIFATTFISEKYDFEDQTFKDRMAMLMVAHQAVDIWTTDKLYELDPETSTDDATSTLKLILALDREVAKEINSMALFFGLALSCARLRRHDWENHKRIVAEVFGKVRDLWGEKVQFKFISLSTVFARLPQLPQDRDEALYLLEKTTQDVASLMNFSINPQIIEEKGQMVWIVD